MTSDLTVEEGKEKEIGREEELTFRFQGAEDAQVSWMELVRPSCHLVRRFHLLIRLHLSSLLLCLAVFPGS